MSINDKKGINVTSGFKLVAPTPIDARFIAQDENDLQSLIDNGAVYNGLEVWVNSLSKKLRYNGTQFEEITSGGTSEQTSIMNLPRHSITISNPTSNNFEFDTPLTPDKEYIVSMSVRIISNVYLNFTASVLYGLNITNNQYIVTPMFGELGGQWLSVSLFIVNGTLSGKVCVETTNGDFNINTIQEFVNATGCTVKITFFENRDIGLLNV